MTGPEAIATAHDLRTAGDILSWQVHYCPSGVGIHALIAERRYGRDTAWGESASYEAAMLALLWQLDTLERKTKGTDA